MAITWTHLHPAHDPGTGNRIRYAWGYDTVRGVTVLYGAGPSSGTKYDTYEWDGVDWTQKLANSPPTVPDSGFVSSTMAYHASTGKMVMVGGHTVGGPPVYDHFQTYTYDYTVPSWTLQSPAHHPADSIHPQNMGLAPYPDTGKVVLFGGISNVGNQSYTWTWDGTDWTQESPTHVPAATEAPCLWYDKGRGVVGLLDRNLHTWEWDGTDWTQIFPATSPTESPCQGVWCEGLGVIIFYGGTESTSTPSTQNSDTWQYDGAAGDWTLLSPTANPGARSNWQIVSPNPTTNSVVLYGGRGGSNDTWILDGVPAPFRGQIYRRIR